MDDDSDILKVQEVTENDALNEIQSNSPSKRPITKSQKLSQVQNLFSESQKIAYVGLCYLSITHYMRQKLAKGKIKQFKHAFEAYTEWSNSFLQRLYLYIDISPKEIEMIKHLAEHGVLPHDLALSVLQESEVLAKMQSVQLNSATESPLVDSEPSQHDTEDLTAVSNEASNINTNVTEKSTDTAVLVTGTKVYCDIKDTDTKVYCDIKDTDNETLVPESISIDARDDELQSKTNSLEPRPKIEPELKASHDDNDAIESQSDPSQKNMEDLLSESKSADANIRNELTDDSTERNLEKPPDFPNLVIDTASDPKSDNIKSDSESANKSKGNSSDMPARSSSYTYESKLLPNDPRVTILSHLFLLCITDGTYTAYERSLLRAVAEHLDIAPDDLFILERILTLEVRMYEDDLVEKDVSAIEAQARREQRRRWALMGIATVGGGLVIGLTAGLAAPFIGAGVATALGALGVTGTGAALTSVGAVAVITTGGVLTGSGMSGYHMARRTADIREFEFVQNPPGKGEEKYLSKSDERYVEWEKREKERKQQEKLAKKQKQAPSAKDASDSELNKSLQNLSATDLESASSNESSINGLSLSHKSLSVDSLSSSSSIATPADVSADSFDAASVLSSPAVANDGSHRPSKHASHLFVENPEVKKAQSAEENSARPPTVIISIAGWATKGIEDFWEPFSVLSPIYGDHYSLVWESKALAELGSALNLFASELVSFGVQQLLGATVLPVLMGALTGPLWAMKLSYFVDNPWGVGLTKARKAGEILAETLIKNVQCGRPVTLIGFSLGARVIFYCLLTLYDKKAFGLVEEVYLFGTPVSASKSQWVSITSVVTGKIVNGFTTKDWLLGVVYRTGNWGLVAGLSEIQGVPGIDNVDLSNIVQGHLAYRLAMPRILKMCGLNVTKEILPEEEERLAEEAEKKKQLELAQKQKAEADELKSAVSATENVSTPALIADPNLPEISSNQIQVGDVPVEKILQKLTDAGAQKNAEQLGFAERAASVRIGNVEKEELGNPVKNDTTSPVFDGKKASKKSFWWFGSSASSSSNLTSDVMAEEELNDFEPKEIKSTMPPLIISNLKDEEISSDVITMPLPVQQTHRRQSESAFASEHGPPLESQTGGVPKQKRNLKNESTYL